jgi:predicted TPR repeat methyltransferase
VAQNNYQLGIKHLAAGNFSDAVFRFKAVTWLEPSNAEAWYNLATSYLADRKPSLAVQGYRRTLELKPDYEEAAYMLAVALGKKVTPQEMPRKMPLTLVTSHFEGLAEDYNRQQVEQGQYKGHIKLGEAARSVLQSGRMDHVVLDLGCGTGLCGAELRHVASAITGVDISPKMLIEAMKLKDTNNRKIFDELIQREAEGFLKDAYADYYDVILAGVTFSFIGDVSAIFTQALRTLKTGGILAFTADKTDGKDYVFDPAGGRFRFSKDYFQKLAAECGFKELRFDEIEAYPGYNMWLVILRK